MKIIIVSTLFILPIIARANSPKCLNIVDELMANMANKLEGAQFYSPRHLTKNLVQRGSKEVEPTGHDYCFYRGSDCYGAPYVNLHKFSRNPDITRYYVFKKPEAPKYKDDLYVYTNENDDLIGVTLPNGDGFEVDSNCKIKNIYVSIEDSSVWGRDTVQLTPEQCSKNVELPTLALGENVEDLKTYMICQSPFLTKHFPTQEKAIISKDQQEQMLPK